MRECLIAGRMCESVGQWAFETRPCLGQWDKQLVLGGGRAEGQRTLDSAMEGKNGATYAQHATCTPCTDWTESSCLRETETSGPRRRVDPVSPPLRSSRSAGGFSHCCRYTPTSGCCVPAKGCVRWACFSPPIPPRRQHKHCTVNHSETCQGGLRSEILCFACHVCVVLSIVVLRSSHLTRRVSQGPLTHGDTDASNRHQHRDTALFASLV